MLTLIHLFQGWRSPANTLSSFMFLWSDSQNSGTWANAPPQLYSLSMCFSGLILSWRGYYPHMASFSTHSRSKPNTYVHTLCIHWYTSIVLFIHIRGICLSTLLMLTLTLHVIMSAYRQHNYHIVIISVKKVNTLQNELVSSTVNSTYMLSYLFVLYGARRKTPLNASQRCD